MEGWDGDAWQVPSPPRSSPVSDPSIPPLVYLDDVITNRRPYNEAQKWIDGVLSGSPLPMGSLELTGEGKEGDPFVVDDGSAGFAFSGSFPPESYYERMVSPLLN